MNSWVSALRNAEIPPGSRNSQSSLPTFVVAPQQSSTASSAPSQKPQVQQQSQPQPQQQQQQSVAVSPEDNKDHDVKGLMDVIQQMDSAVKKTIDISQVLSKPEALQRVEELLKNLDGAVKKRDTDVQYSLLEELFDMYGKTKVAVFSREKLSL